MKRTVFLFFIFGFITFLGCSKKRLNYSEKAMDSIPIYLVLANQDSVPHQKRLEYNKKAFDVFISQENDSMNRVNLFKIANRYFNMGNREEYKKITQIVLGKAIEHNDTVSIAKAYGYLGDYYIYTSNKDSVFFYYAKAKKIYQKRNDKINLAGIYINTSIVQGYEKDFLGSELSAIKALNVLRGTTEKSKIFQAYNLLGVVSSEMKDYEKAIKNYNKALDLVRENNLTDLNEEARVLNNIGNAYQHLDKDKMAIEKFQAALKDKSLYTDPNLHAVVLNNLAYSKFKLKDYSLLPDLFYKSLKIRDSLGLTLGIVYNKVHLSEYYAAIGDTLTSRRFARESLELSREIRSYRDVLSALNQLSIVDPQTASIYNEEYIKINDSLQISEQKARDKFARIRYETDEVILEKDKAVFQKWTVFWIAVSTLLFGLVFYVFRIRRSKQRELYLLFSQLKAGEEIYRLISERHQKFEEGRKKEKKRIAKELHDGVMSRLSDIRSSLLVLESKTDSETVRHCINQVAEIQDVEKEVRNIAHGLDRDSFSTKGDYPEILTSVTEEFANKASLKIDFEIDKTIDWNALDSQKKLGIYQILQECLHALGKQETDITIRFYKDNSLLVMEVKDVGFDIKNYEKEQILKGISLRAKEMGADLRISNILDRKTLLRMTMLMKTDKNS
ncbi:tetratricopeptide repeat-containing sensor histidine kinase [Flavobacterium microcysteis]|uniref:Tetratricopeptide repeat protein n=1 Tax=Flavobacterium microcysteis TaxID=2596891 RepID=A0A501PZ23_9FLAO|nr:tetratricopeptide repeat-containing sensor histidine kinase [Flavobacterium microcysteis]TPD65297.1 tetratricopeptide repeat protein [Flavobacterium microcysteis]